MPKKFLRRLMPDHRTIREHRHLRFLGTLLHDPNLWHLNRRSASGAFAVGLFTAWIPIPFQMLVAAIGAILFRVNLPLSAALVWITNPLTMPPMFYFAYLVGGWVLGGVSVDHIAFEPSVRWLTTELVLIWQPFLLGCLILGTTSAAAGYLAIRGLWRLHLVNYYRRRKQRRLLKRHE
ncbi:MAG: DUF2062 domain-containing protein [Gammaproteobacteria bacterium]|nr:DUF2062 domain-containing protein [Gammaproteobacteria bacterium]